MRRKLWSSVDPTDVNDPELDEMLAEMKRDESDEYDDPTRCTDPAAHSGTFDGLRLYLRRRGRGMSRVDLEDKLLDGGIDVTTDTIAAWELGLFEAHAKGAPAITAAALFAMPCILGGTLGDFIHCWDCRKAAHPERYADLKWNLHRHRTMNGKLFADSRARLGLSRESTAKKARVKVREVELIERGKSCVGINSFLAVCHVLDVDPESATRAALGGA